MLILNPSGYHVSWFCSRDCQEAEIDRTRQAVEEYYGEKVMEDVKVFVSKLAGLVMKELKKHKFKPKLSDMKYYTEDPLKEMRHMQVCRMCLNRRRYVCNIVVHEEYIEVRAGCGDCYEKFSIVDPEFLDNIVKAVKWRDSRGQDAHNDTCRIARDMRRMHHH
jgi:hypothetical protein